MTGVPRPPAPSSHPHAPPPPPSLQTLRKFLSMCGSLVLFGHVSRLAPLQGLGIVLVFGGVGLDIWTLQTERGGGDRPRAAAGHGGHSSRAPRLLPKERSLA